MYSRPRSISAWIDSIYAAPDQSELVPTQPASRPPSTASAHTRNPSTYTSPRTRRSMMDGSKRQRNVRSTERTTRSSSRRHERMTAEVAALQISDGTVSEGTATAEVANGVQNETHDSGDWNRIAQCPPLSHPSLPLCRRLQNLIGCRLRVAQCPRGRRAHRSTQRVSSQKLPNNPLVRPRCREVDRKAPSNPW
jgi:hypothetical protein